MKKHKLAWVDGFFKRIKPYVYMRLSDNVLIRMPNEAFKLNTTGARIIAHILDGGSVLDFIKVRADFPEIENQLERFFVDFLRVWNDEICENYSTDAVRRVEFNLGYIKLPVLSEVALTYSCNIKCRFCYASCTQSKKTSLDIEGFKKVLDIIRYEAEVPSVSFTGGEPLLNKDLPKLIKYASKKNKMRVNLITNGTLITPRKAKELARMGLSSAQVSIESANSLEHDKITGVSGAHERSVAGLKALKEAGIIVHPHMTISSLNKDNLMKYPYFCKEIGADRFSANIVIPAGRGSDEELKISYSQIGGLVTALMKEAEKAGVKFMWYSPTPICLFNPLTAGLGNKGCSACEGLLSVDPVGNVLPCSSWPEPVGNLLEEGFKSVWFKKKSKWIRAKEAAPKECKSCKYFVPCQGACPLYFKVHGCGELHNAWKSLGLSRERSTV